MLYITNNRKTDYVIVYRKDHTPSEETAALELASYLEKITGVKFPVVTDDAKKTDCEIVVGFASRPGCKKSPIWAKRASPSKRTASACSFSAPRSAARSTAFTPSLKIISAADFSQATVRSYTKRTELTFLQA